MRPLILVRHVGSLSLSYVPLFLFFSIPLSLFFFLSPLFLSSYFFFLLFSLSIFSSFFFFFFS
jgi:hypothetical protein